MMFTSGWASITVLAADWAFWWVALPAALMETYTKSVYPSSTAWVKASSNWKGVIWAWVGSFSWLSSTWYHSSGVKSMRSKYSLPSTLRGKWNMPMPYSSSAPTGRSDAESVKIFTLLIEYPPYIWPPGRSSQRYLVSCPCSSSPGKSHCRSTS